MSKSQENINTAQESGAQELNSNNRPEEQQQLSYKSLYLKEKKKSSIFLILTVVFTILFFGSLAWGLTEAKDNKHPEFRRNNIMSEKFEQRMGPGMGDYNDIQQNDRNRFKMKLERFINSDGTVNTNEVKDFLSNLPDQAKNHFREEINDNLERAVKDGKISQDQANSIKSAITN